MEQQQARAADAEWVRAAVSRFEGPLVRYATRLLGDVERARDVVQDTFLKLWETDRVTVDGHLAPWLYTVCRNRALDVCRKERRMTTLDSQNVKATADGDAGDHGEGGDDGLLALVAGLPDRQQEAVRLKFQGGLSYREIAEVKNTTVNNVGVLLHTAIKSIRTRMTAAAAARSTR